MTFGIVAALLVWRAVDAVLPHGAPMGVVLVGAVLGGVTCLAALGLILVYQATRVVNFAAIALGSAGGMLGLELFRRAGWNYFAAMAVAVVASIAVGALVDVTVVRRFARSSGLLLTVATIGLAQVLGGIALLLPRLFGAGDAIIGAFSTPVPGRIRVDPVVLTGNHVAIAAAVPVAVVALSWFLRRTDVGTAVRGAAENRERALLLGIPVPALSTVVWAIAGGLAGATFVLKAPFQGVTPEVVAGPGLLLAPLAAAVLARMESVGVAVVAGVGLGVLQELVAWNSNAPTMSDVAMLAVILVALVVQRDRLSRGEHATSSAWLRATAVRPLHKDLSAMARVRAVRTGALGLGVALVIVAPFVAAPSTVNLLSVAAVWGAVAVSLVILTGWGGHISLGQFALVGCGALVAGNLVERAGLDLFVTLLLAGAAGGAAALVLGVPALRIRGPFLAVTTLAFAIALDTYFLNPTYFSWVPQEISRPALLSRMPLESERAMYFLCLALLALVVFVARGIRKARTGRVLVAVRDNDRAAEAMAVPATAVRLSAFVLSGVVAGVAGGLHVLLLHGARFGSYQPIQSLQVFSGAVIGGVGSVGGALLGVFGLRLAGALAPAYRLLVTGTGVLVVLLAVPGGLGQALATVRDRVLWRVAGGRPRPGTFEAANAAPRHESVDGDVALLTCESVECGYGDVQVLFGVDFDVRDGEIVALLGTNGAGKSTLLKVIAGLLSPSGGSLALRGEVLDATSAQGRAAQGVSLMPGGKSIFPTLTVDENLRLAAWLLRDDRPALAAATEEVLALFPALRPLRSTRAGDLSGGEQQMLSLAQVLLLRPRLLMIDELSLGLAPGVVAQLLDVVRSLPERGTTVVLVEQSVNVALEVAHRAVFLEKGEVRFSGATAELLDRPDLLRSVFIGSGVDAGRARQRRPRRRPAGGTPVLRCAQVEKRFGGVRALDGVDLEVAPGEIVGLIGTNGAGKTTLLDCISGFVSVDGGAVEVLGDDVTRWPAWRRARLGLGRSFQDARLYPSLTVAETVAVALERHVICRDPVADAMHLPASYESELSVGDRVDELIESMGLGDYRDTAVAELSTGTRRIVDLACVLGQSPSVLLLDEPSSGIAQREAEALAPLLRQVRERTGCAMVVVEHDMPLLSSIVDRMVALDLGRVIAEGTPRAVLEHRSVVEAYLGTDRAAIERSTLVRA